MGANAVTTVPTYTAGEVLTAANLNITNSGVPVFATTVTRDAAFGGTGEKTLAEGQLCYLESTNVVQYYDGASWATVGPATAGALVYITGATFSAVASVSLPTNTFSATYSNYRVIFVGTAVSTTLSYSMRMRASGTDNTNANYSSGVLGRSNADTEIKFTSDNQTSWALGGTDGGAQPMSVSFDICDPFASSKTQLMGAGRFNATSGGAGGATFGAFHNTTTSFDSLSLIASTGTISGFYRVYGYADS